MAKAGEIAALRRCALSVMSATDGLINCALKVHRVRPMFAIFACKVIVEQLMFDVSRFRKLVS